MKFVYNNGSTAHRGVWHIAEEVTITDVPAKSYDNSYTHRGTKEIPVADFIEGKEYYRPSRAVYSQGWHGDLTYVDEPFGYMLLGVTTYTVTTPAHQKYEGEAICGQVNCRSDNLFQIWSHPAVYSRKNIGKHLELAGGRVGPLLVKDIDGETPLPICSRCEKKAGLR